MTYHELMLKLDKAYNKALDAGAIEASSKIMSVMNVLLDNEFLFDGREVPNDIIVIIVGLYLRS